jgi:hypothetical protein
MPSPECVDTFEYGRVMMELKIWRRSTAQTPMAGSVHISERRTDDFEAGRAMTESVPMPHHPGVDTVDISAPRSGNEVRNRVPYSYDPNPLGDELLTDDVPCMSKYEGRSRVKARSALDRGKRQLGLDPSRYWSNVINGLRTALETRETTRRTALTP